MKYLSVLFFAAALGWTWSVVHSSSQTPFETHASIQDKLAQLIQKTVFEKKPDAVGFAIDRLWTEPLPSGKIKAHFIYRFSEKSSEDAVVESRIVGESTLEKQADDQSGHEKWSITQIKTNNDAVIFQDAMIITPGEEPATE